MFGAYVGKSANNRLAQEAFFVTHVKLNIYKALNFWLYAHSNHQNRLNDYALVMVIGKKFNTL